MEDANERSANPFPSTIKDNPDAVGLPFVADLVRRRYHKQTDWHMSTIANKMSRHHGALATTTIRIQTYNLYELYNIFFLPTTSAIIV